MKTISYSSGVKSKKFWARINAIPELNDPESLLYTLGCILQSVEGQVIRELERCEKKAKEQHRRRSN
jgi:hypothetical protein